MPDSDQPVHRMLSKGPHDLIVIGSEDTHLTWDGFCGPCGLNFTGLLLQTQEIGLEGDSLYFRPTFFSRRLHVQRTDYRFHWRR
jgi:hypothetical protein